MFKKKLLRTLNESECKNMLQNERKQIAKMQNLS